MTKTIILPSCDDGNRGDQALVWRTREIVAAAGIADECLMLTDKVYDSPQSEAEGIGMLMPILRHPSSRFVPKSNMNYGSIIYIIWGLISIVDGVRSLLLLNPITRVLFSVLFSSSEKKTLTEFKSADAFVVKGGGFIHTTNSLADSYKAYFFLYHVLLAQSLGKPVYVMPNSFGPLEGAFYQSIVRKALSRCKVVASRESVSQDMLSAIGVKSQLFPDLAFGLESSKNASGYLHSVRLIHKERPIVGITARPYRFPGASNPKASYEKYISEMATFARSLYAQGFVPVFVEHVLSQGEHESDITAIDAITARLKAGEYEVFRNSILNCRQLKAVYGECDFVVGTRFHSVIFALSEGIPAIAIGYGGNKGRGIMRDLGFPELVIPIEDFSSIQAMEIFKDAKNNPRLIEKVETLEALAKSRHNEIVKLIERTRK